MTRPTIVARALKAISGKRELLVVDAHRFARDLGRKNPEQPLLRLTDRDYFGRHSIDRHVDLVEIDLRAIAALRGDLGRTADEAAGAEIFESGGNLLLAQ